MTWRQRKTGGPHTPSVLKLSDKPAQKILTLKRWINLSHKLGSASFGPARSDSPDFDQSVFSASTLPQISAGHAALFPLVPGLRGFLTHRHQSMILLFQEPLVLFFRLADCVQHPTGQRLCDFALQGMIVPERLLFFRQRYLKEHPHRIGDRLLVTELYPVPHGIGLR